MCRGPGSSFLSGLCDHPRGRVSAFFIWITQSTSASAAGDDSRAQAPTFRDTECTRDPSSPIGIGHTAHKPYRPHEQVPVGERRKGSDLILMTTLHPFASNDYSPAMEPPTGHRHRRAQHRRP
jgi:hypothetical protein